MQLPNSSYCTESGSGSGGVLAPDCPSTPIQVNITRPINTEFLSQVLLTGMSFPTSSQPDNRSVSITQIKLRPEAVNYRVAEGDVTVHTKLDDGKLTVTVVGDLVSATSVIVDISILDEDDMMMGSSCKFSIEIAVLNRTNCVVEESSIIRISDDTQLFGFYAITLTLIIPVADVSVLFISCNVFGPPLN